ncbi:MAG: Bug family tripartite tricarboxylate transporter substrate binding protein [Burkholderiaceae bacterium]
MTKSSSSAPQYRRSSSSRRAALAAVAAALAVPLAAGLPTGAAYAQAFPNKPLRIIVPFPPGGSTDLLARRIAEKLSVSFGQPVIVENKPGAGGTLGSDQVAKSAPDGYTLLMGVTGSNAIAGALYQKLPYDPAKDFDPVTMVVSAPLVLVTNQAMPGTTVADFIAHAKRNPEKVTHGSPGNGTSMHLTGEMFALASETRLVHIPYKGSAGAVQDLLGGQISAMFGDLLVVLPYVKEGRLKAIAVTSKQRHPMLPDVPTVAESGLRDFEALSWQGLFAPAGTPAPVLARLNEETVKALKSPDMHEFFATRGFVVGGNSPAEAKRFIQDEVAKWGRIVKASGAKVD